MPMRKPAAMPMRKPAASATMAVSQPDEDQVQPLLLWDIFLHCKNPQRLWAWRDSLRQGGSMLHEDWLQDQLQKAKAQAAAKKPAAKTQPAAMKGKGHTNKGQGKTKKAMSRAKAKTKK